MYRDNVIKAIEICIKNGCKDGIPNKLCPYSSEVGCDLNQILLDALALLKEQEDSYKNILSDYESLAREHEKLLDKKIPLITNGQEVVRCKDCKHGRLYEPNAVDCEYRELATEPDWFCADGEAKE